MKIIAKTVGCIMQRWTWVEFGPKFLIWDTLSWLGSMISLLRVRPDDECN